MTQNLAKNLMTQDLAKNFWKRWHEANELERLNLVLTLTGMKDYGTASLANSYLTDLEIYLEEYYKEHYDPALNE